MGNANGKLPDKIGLALFFTFEMSLEKWERAHLLGRELAIYRWLSEKGVKVSFMTYGDSFDKELAESLPAGAEVKPLFENAPRNPWLRFFLSWIKPLTCAGSIRGVDIIKTNQMWGAWAGLLSKVILRKKWILRCGFEHHRALLAAGAGIRERTFSFLFSWFAYRLADIVVWTSPFDREWAGNRFGLNTEEKKFRVIPNYFDPELFRPSGDTAGENKILAVGRLTRQKNFAALIRALEGTGIELELVGEGELRAPLEELANKLHVEVKFRGVLPHKELSDLMRSNGIFVLPSFYEGHPKALIEALACGMAVICADIPEVREVVRDGLNGLLCANSPTALRAAVLRLLQDRDLRTKLAREAARQARKRFSLDAVAHTELELYRELCS